MTRIAYLDYSEVFAGAERVLHSIITSLDRSKYEPLLVFPYPREHQRRYNDLDCKKIHLAPSVKWWMGHWRWPHPLRGTDELARTIWGIRLARLLKSEDVSILHVNLLRPDCYRWLLPSYRAGIKVIGHFRSQSLEWVPSADVQRLCDLVLCVSNYSRSRFLSKGTFSRVETLYDSIDISRFRPHNEQSRPLNTLGIPNHALLISSIGQLSPQKGHDTAIHAFARIADHFPSSVLLIAGSGIMEHQLRNIIESFPEIKDRIILTGKQIDIIQDVYSSSSLVLSLTNMGEAFGLVPYEAALSGAPCIAPAFGAVTEFLEDGVSGLLVDTRNVDAVAQKMEWALTHPTETARITDRACQIIRTRLNPSIMASNLDKAYSSLL